MKNPYNQNIIVIDLSKHNDDSFPNLLLVNGLDGRVNPDVLTDLKKAGYLKVWLDTETIGIICFTHINNKREVVFQLDYLTYLKSLPSLSFKEIEDDKNESYNIDDLLDKISSKGIESLSKKELSFLNNSGKV